ncbi:MAG: hypothetical protein QOH67_5081 [Hyphomicrobiales bacterium]|nr:hypothetical protein [Hyphomicrobiales bacterium]
MSVPLIFTFPALLLVYSTAGRSQTKFTISTVAGNGAAAYSGDGGSAINAGLNDPNGVAVDAAGNLYIAEYLGERVRKVATNGTITTVAGTGVLGFSGDGGPATMASLNGPFRVALDRAGNLYVSDNGNHRVRKVTSDGTIITVAGNGSANSSGDGGPATDAAIGAPGDLALDVAGNLFIASPAFGGDFSANVIRKVTPGGLITTVAGNGIAGYSGDGGLATGAALNAPEGLAIDSTGNLFIADQINQRIRKVSNGIIETVAGNGTAGYSGDGGPAISAELSGPAGMSFDAAGNLYIADRDNNRVRVLLTDGTISTVAGNGSAAWTGDGGPATSAALDSPRSVAILAGAVYIADARNERIRLLAPSQSDAPSIAPNGIVPIFSSSNIIQPGSLISIYGSNLATGTVSWNEDFATTLGGTSVTINNKPAYPWFVSPFQINVQAPDDTATGIVNVVVTTPTGAATSTVTLEQFGPSFSVLDGKHVAGIILRSDGSGAYGGGTYDIVGPTGASLGYRTVAAKAGDILILFGVGFGPTTPAVPAGEAWSGGAATTNSIQLLINNIAVAPAFSGIVSAGLYQMNIVPVLAGLGIGDVPVLATVGGARTQSGVVLSLQ